MTVAATHNALIFVAALGHPGSWRWRSAKLLHHLVHKDEAKTAESAAVQELLHLVDRVATDTSVTDHAYAAGRAGASLARTIYSNCPLCLSAPCSVAGGGARGSGPERSPGGGERETPAPSRPQAKGTRLKTNKPPAEQCHRLEARRDQQLVP